LISDRQNLIIIGRRNSVGVGVRQHPVVGIQSAPEFENIRSPESGHEMTKFRPEFTGFQPSRPGSGRIWMDPAIDPAGSGQNGQDPAGSRRIRQLVRPDPEDSGLNPAILAGSGQTFSPESGNGDRTLPDSGDNYQTLIFAFCNFFV